MRRERNRNLSKIRGVEQRLSLTTNRNLSGLNIIGLDVQHLVRLTGGDGLMENEW